MTEQEAGRGADLRPLLLTGPPAAGKSTTARALAARLPLAAVLDVDDIRQLVVSGHAAPWDGPAGAEQQRIGVENTCDLARRFSGAGIPVVIADVVSPATAALYRSCLTAVMIIHLRISLEEARRRASQRPVHLTDAEFGMLHRDHPDDPALYDHVIEVDGLDLEAQVEAVRCLWS